jgi:AcrR family transcriptional regulator
MSRSYDMTKRARSASANRQGILDAAHELLGRSDGGTLTLQEVAEAAGVSRATIYNRVGSRADLLTAVFEDQGRLIGFGRVLAAMADPDPAHAVLETVRESARAWEVMPVAIRRTKALAVMDDEVGDLVRTFEGYRRREIAVLVERAHRDGVLSGEGPVEALSATLALLTSFESYDHLRLLHSAAEATDILLRTAARSLGIDIDEKSST